MLMYSGYLREDMIFACAYDLEQELAPRATRQYLNSLPAEPPDAGICSDVRKGEQQPPRSAKWTADLVAHAVIFSALDLEDAVRWASRALHFRAFASRRDASDSTEDPHEAAPCVKQCR
jgi:hypothetical protein